MSWQVDEVGVQGIRHWGQCDGPGDRGCDRRCLPKDRRQRPLPSWPSNGA